MPDHDIAGCKVPTRCRTAERADSHCPADLGVILPICPSPGQEANALGELLGRPFKSYPSNPGHVGRVRAACDEGLHRHDLGHPKHSAENSSHPGLTTKCAERGLLRVDTEREILRASDHSAVRPDHSAVRPDRRV